ncbi:MAG: hypothetical protein ACR2PU_02535 [Gammaproteobacteria bacterium]
MTTKELPMGTDLDRYSISVIDDNTLMLTDTDTLQTWQIEILRNNYNESDSRNSNESND